MSLTSPSQLPNHLAISLLADFLGPFATLLAADGRCPAIRGSPFDLGEALSDGRREILPPFVGGLDGVHGGIRDDASQEQNGVFLEA